MFKKILSALLSVVLILSAFSFTVYAKGETVANVQQATKLCIKSKPISIKKGTLYNAGKKVGTVYVIALTGSDKKWDKNDMLGIQTCIKSGMAKDNLYLDALIKSAEKNIPKGSKVVIMGHSLGGMIAQQFAADSKMKERYEILNVLTMGSPYIKVTEREGGLYRMVDSGDYIPYLSTAFFDNFSEGNYTRVNNGYFGRAAAAHTISYQVAENWLKYDCFGIENGTHKITF